MDISFKLPEEIREFIVFGETVIITCNDVEYNMIIMFLINLHAFGRYYWDTWKQTNYGYYDASIYRKISMMEGTILGKIGEYEETVIKKRKREYSINKLLN